MLNEWYYWNLGQGEAKLATGVRKGGDLGVAATEHVWDLFRPCVGEKSDEQNMDVMTPAPVR